MKGQNTAKWQAVKEWVKAVNTIRNFGVWEFKVLDAPNDLFDEAR